MKEYYLCAEIGGTSLRIGVVDSEFNIIEFERTKTKLLSDSPDKGEFIKSILMPYIEKYEHESFKCLSFSIASLMDKDRKLCFNSPNIKGFDNLPLVSIMEDKLKMPVAMERDVNTGLLYEIRKRKIETDGIIIGIFIGTGLGNAMCIGNKIYKGSSGSSCELGHIPVVGFLGECGCGKNGCIELMASGKALKHIAEEKFLCDVSEIFIKHKDDETVINFVKMCAIAAATEITILDPEMTVIGGGVAETLDFPWELFVKTVKENLRIPNPRQNLKIERAFSDPYSGIVGAAINAKNVFDL